MTIERVISPMGGVEVQELFKPTQLGLSTVNQFGFDQSELLTQLGFVPVDERGSLQLMKTPEEIMGRQWGLFYQKGSLDPYLFTVCVQFGIVYSQLLRQISHPANKGEYYIVLS